MRRLYFSFMLVVILGLLGPGCEQEDLPGTPPAPAPPTPAEPPPATQSPHEATDASSTDASTDASADADLPDALPVVDGAALEALIAESAERGQVLVIDFWATWCIPCVVMFPDLHAGLKELGDAVRSVTVTLDDPGDYEQKAIRFLADHEAMEDAFILVSTSEGQVDVVDRLGERWVDLVVPAILVYDPQGELAGEFIDADARTDRILDRVRELVQSPNDHQARADR